jgi:hemoglobin
MNRFINTIALASAALVIGCGSGQKKDRDFHTSGSREADQRAEQRIAKDQQIRGEGDSGDSKVKKPLFDRLGGQEGIDRLVGDFVSRALADPRVNFQRRGITRGGVLGVGDKPVEWNPTDESVGKVKKHIAQFIALATGGPTKYEGRDMKDSHKGMKITNAEFDAAIGDMKATLDAQRVPIEEQKELLAVLESTRSQVVSER